MKKILLLLLVSFLIFNSCNKDDGNPVTPTPPTVPTLSTPSDGAVDVAFPITLTWNAFSGATSYTLRVSIDSAFTSFVFNQSGLTSTTQQMSGLSDSTTYYWHVSADNSSGPSNTWSFKTASSGGSAPGVPTLLSPNNGATDQPLTLALSWNLSSGATSYNLQVSTSNSFTTIFYNQSGIAGTSSQVSGLSNNTKYYWRASGTNNNGSSNWSGVWNFTTAGLPPAVPTLISPVNGETDVLIPVTFSWNASTGAQDYTLQVSTSSSFTNILYNQSGITTTSRQVSGLSGTTTYYWRVIATNTFGASNPSSTWSFTTNDGRPSVPSLLSPSDGAANQSVSPTLTWNASVGATSYTLQVSESNTFTSYVYNQGGLTSTSRQVTSLSTSTTYYWRVRASNTQGTSTWSSVWSFNTGIMNIACPGIPSVTYAGKIYNTVQVGNQCWLKENLDLGVYVASTGTGSGQSDVTNNGIIEKYCYGNIETNCATYGGLYDWNEAMQYITTPGTQGICPTGWHIPTRAEFEALMAAVNNDGNSLKTIGQGTGSGQGTNISGFSALLAGFRVTDGNFTSLGYDTRFWSSTEYGSGSASYLVLYDSDIYIYLGNVSKVHGFSVRCAKD